MQWDMRHDYCDFSYRTFGTFCTFQKHRMYDTQKITFFVQKVWMFHVPFDKLFTTNLMLFNFDSLYLFIRSGESEENMNVWDKRNFWYIGNISKLFINCAFQELEEMIGPNISESTMTANFTFENTSSDIQRWALRIYILNLQSFGFNNVEESRSSLYSPGHKSWKSLHRIFVFRGESHLEYQAYRVSSKLHFI